ncbi:hypothetical protein CL619_00470 [archaeon]|nr:hypothetical protein [archaeon]|tara:strand:+ start:222 stop:533 length:312 start_codon:yes stop_codon:yes gene_type:complete
MGFFDKLKFWKKEEEFSLDTPLPGMNEQPVIPEQSAFPPTGSSPQSPFEQPAAQPGIQQFNNKDLELINSKLDAIKATLGSIEQRLVSVEKAHPQVPEKKMPW